LRKIRDIFFVFGDFRGDSGYEKWKQNSRRLKPLLTPRGRFELPRREAPVAFEATAFPG
jgi:hypothetical protein